MVSFKCPTSQRPMNRGGGEEECPLPVTWPAPPKIDMCCASNCPPRQNDMCFMTVRPMPPMCCPQKPPCGNGGKEYQQFDSKTLFITKKWSLNPLFSFI